MTHLDRPTIESFDALDEPRRRAALGHAVVCGDCRARLLAGDPARAFALLVLEPVPVAALDRLSARLDAAIDREAQPRHRRRYSVAAVAASLLLAALLSLTALRVERPAEIAVAPAAVDDVPVEGVEILSSRGGDAEVFEMAVGEDTQLVMIFDQALEL